MRSPTSQHCEGDGAVQWVQVDFTKNYLVILLLSPSHPALYGLDAQPLWWD